MKKVEAMADGLKLFGIGASWGGFESLVCPTSRAVRTATKLDPTRPILRFHIGLEDVGDLIADLQRRLRPDALKQAAMRKFDHLVLRGPGSGSAAGFLWPHRLHADAARPASLRHRQQPGAASGQFPGAARASPIRRRSPSRQPGKFSFGAYNQAFLEKREGFSMLVLASKDAAADAAEFKRLGLDAYDVFKFGREATLPDGSKARVDFSLAFVTEPSMPEAVFFTCQQHAPQYFWRPEYQRHANGAIRIAEVVMSAGDPARYQSFFSRLMGESATTIARWAGGRRGRRAVDDPGSFGAGAPISGDRAP